MQTPFARFLIRRRNELGYRKIEFSKLVGVGDDTLRYWERGRFKPAGIHKDILADILKMTEEEIDLYFGRVRCVQPNINQSFARK